MTSSDAPSLSRRHWISNMDTPDLSESCPANPPANQTNKYYVCFMCICGSKSISKNCLTHAVAM